MDTKSIYLLAGLILGAGAGVGGGVYAAGQGQGLLQEQLQGGALTTPEVECLNTCLDPIIANRMPGFTWSQLTAEKKIDGITKRELVTFTANGLKVVPLADLPKGKVSTVYVPTDEETQVEP